MWNQNNRMEFRNCIDDLIKTANVQALNGIGAHHSTNCYEHSIFVAYISFLFCRKFHMDFTAAARGGLLHDLFLYNRKDPVNPVKKHLRTHPSKALENASKAYSLTEKEKDIILKHMWPVTLRLPKYKESFVVSTVDKICAVIEVLPLYRLFRVRNALQFH